jgi:hypothetical protein
MSPLLRLPLCLRLQVFEYALQVEFIQYHKRTFPVKVKHGTYGQANLDYIGDYMAREPHFQISDSRRGHARFRPLSGLLSLTLVSRQIRSEAAPLLIELNIFHVTT